MNQPIIKMRTFLGSQTMFTITSINSSVFNNIISQKQSIKFQFYWLIKLLNTELSILVIVNIVWDPKNVCSFIFDWFIVTA